MSKNYETTAVCEMAQAARRVLPVVCEIRILKARGFKISKIDCEICNGYGNERINDSMVQGWVRLFFSKT